MEVPSRFFCYCKECGEEVTPWCFKQGDYHVDQLTSFIALLEMTGAFFSIFPFSIEKNTRNGECFFVRV